jgi:CheY-like chemotaxis protein
MRNDHSFLYVEDDATSREVMEILIIHVLGFPKLTLMENSENFEQRLDALHPRPDVIFLDIHVPPHDGFTMLKMIRKLPGYENAIVVALTASVMNEEVEQLRLSGFDCGIAKPIQQSLFPKLLERILNGEKVWHIV